MKTEPNASNLTTATTSNDAGWSPIDSGATANQLPSSALELRDGGHVDVIPRGAPHPIKTFYEGRRKIVGPGVDVPPGTKIDTRVLLNFWDTATKTVRVGDVTLRTYDTYRLLRPTYPFDQWVFRYARNRNESNEVRYTVHPLRPQTPSEKTAVATATLHDLAAFAVAAYGGGEAAAVGAVTTAAPVGNRISAELAQDIRAMLADRASEALATLCATFGVTAVEDVAEGQAQPAYQYAVALCGEYPVTRPEPESGSGNV